jgi:hypothetical protein
MKLFKHVVLALAVVFSAGAHAQRTPVSIVDFKAVPVQADKPRTANDVRVAFLRAAALQQWQVTPVSDGVLEATLLKNGKHTVVGTVTYDAAQYTFSYKSSIDMKYDDLSGRFGNNSGITEATSKQKALFAADPLTPFAVARPNEVLHPFYELWVRRLLAGVNAELKATS